MTPGPPGELPRFSSPLVRDLVWVARCAPLLDIRWPPGSIRNGGNRPFLVSDPSHWLLEEDLDASWERVRPLLSGLDEDPSPLERWIAPFAGRRRGHLFEGLLAWWFMMDPSVEILGMDIPLYRLQRRSRGKEGNKRGSSRRSLGEIDFMLDWEGEIVHLEVAVKYYLGLPGAGADLSRYVGRDFRERLDEKVSHMLNHQRETTGTPEGVAALEYRKIPRPDRRLVSLRGILFPALADLPDREVPRYWWGSPGDFLRRLPSDSRWMPAGENHWFGSPWGGSRESSLTGLRSRDELFSPEELLRQESWFVSGQPCLVIGREETPRGDREFSRGFICQRQF
ncbi:DUF1853 family protein [Alkalispirochaeta sphaeroplastigenens]|uniref:DUF1853 family protein n=1 Tax=Alkalispirochaeta sphaeroplastigenens TaxID=1187066 RepID=UPI0015E18F5B|nr:DUF1853 family protein [Alkalispirochaeta sphaeroplastigenens]